MSFESYSRVRSLKLFQSDVEEFIKVRLAKVLDLRGTVRLFCIEELVFRLCR